MLLVHLFLKDQPPSGHNLSTFLNYVQAILDIIITTAAAATALVVAMI
jgi:hypothetical protein